MTTRRVAAPTTVSVAVPPANLTSSCAPPVAQAVQTLKIRASVERAMRRARQRAGTPEDPDERARRAHRTEARARELARQEKWGAAAQAGLRAAHLDPANARHWLQTARWQRQDGDPFGAVETMHRALHHIEETAEHELRAMLIEALLECGEWEACARECHTLLQNEPRHHAALDALGTALLHQGRGEEAADTFRALLRLSPRDPIHRLKLAMLLHVQGHLGAALREFERVIALAPASEWAQEAQDAIESLDHLQIEGIMLCASRPDSQGEEFRHLARRNLDAALARHDFHLSEAGRETLRHLLCEGRPLPEITPLLPRVH